MKLSRVVLCLVAVVALSAAVIAQSDKAADKDKGKNITLTGCLGQGTDANTFTLTSASSKDPTPASTKANPPSEKTYALTPASGVDLKAHVGHKVTITGRHEGGSELARTEPGAAAAMPHKIEVKSVKHVSPTCP